MQRVLPNIALSAGLLGGIHFGCARLELEAVGQTPSCDGFQRVAASESRQSVVLKSLRERLQNFMQVSTDVYVGGEPSDETAFGNVSVH